MTTTKLYRVTYTRMIDGSLATVIIGGINEDDIRSQFHTSQHIHSIEEYNL